MIILLRIYPKPVIFDDVKVEHVFYQHLANFKVFYPSIKFQQNAQVTEFI